MRKLPDTAIFEGMYPLVYFFGHAFPSYFLWTSLTACLCLWILVKRATVDRRWILDLYLVLMVASLVGARLFHVVYEEPTYYFEDWTRIFELWKGGYVFFGGFLGAWACGVLYWKIRPSSEVSLAALHDVFAPVVSFGYMFGRLGCLLAGCCYGRFCELPWSMSGRHPTALYSSLWELGVLMVLLGADDKLKKKPGQLFWLWLGLHSLGRFIIEFYRDDFRGPTLGISISGWISVVLCLISLFFLFAHKKTRLL